MPAAGDTRRGASTKSSLITPASAGATNRLRVLELLHSRGPLSRAELARAFGVSRATVGTILQPLLDSNALVEGDAGAAGRLGGKPARPLWFSDEGRRLGAIEILPGLVRATLLTVAGDAVRTTTTRFAARSRDARAFDAALSDAVSECLAGERLLGVGVAAAGLVDAANGVVVEVNAVPALRGYPVVAEVSRLLSVPAFVEHHARVQALGDRWFGSGRALDSFASVSTGDSVGIGIVYQGAVVSPPGGASGAHMTVAKDGERCTCGKRGCWKTLTTTAWLRRRAAELGVAAPSRVTVTKLAKRRADRGVTALLDEYAGNVALGLGNVEQMLGPGVFVLHGDAVGGGDELREAIEQRLRQESPRRHEPDQPRVVASDPDVDAVATGCGGLVLSNALDLIR